jgi:CrcB protein
MRGTAWRPDVLTVVVLALSATLGALLRYGLTLWATARFGGAFPVGTLLVNAIGCLVLGFFMTVATERLTLSREVRLFVATGFCGSLTTFSTFGYETVMLWLDGRYVVALVNVVGSLVVGVGCVVAGVVLARAV